MQTINNEVREFSIQGMHCTACAARIERGLSVTSGVQRVAVNFAAHSAVVQSVLPAGVIIEKIESMGFEAVPAQDIALVEKLRRREQKSALRDLVLALVLGLPVIAVGMVHSLAAESWARWFSAALTLALLAVPAHGFFVRAVALVRKRTANMDTLIALGAGISFLWSCVHAYRNHDALYFETAAAIVTFVMIGKYLEQRMTWRATSSLGALLHLQPQSALRLKTDGSEDYESVDVRFLKTGDVLLSRAGERFAADGKIIEGLTEVDESLLTGESRPIVKSAGDGVSAGALNRTGAVKYSAQAVGPQSRLGEIVRFVERTQLSKAPIQRLADRVSAVFVPVILALSLLTFTVWFFILNLDFSGSINAAVSVLVVACPCALGLATPIAVAVATSRAARCGILFRDLAALESLQSVQTIVLDKTGTLTHGRLAIESELWFEDSFPAELDRTTIRRLVQQLEQGSAHPVAETLVAHLKMQSAAPSELQHVYSLEGSQEVAGTGMNAIVRCDGRAIEIQVGRAAENEMAQLPLSERRSWVVCRLNSAMCAAWSLSDVLRPEATELIKTLRGMNVQAILASGDHPDVVRAVAETLRIPSHAQQTPHMKAELVRSLQAQGQRVAMLGDGVNDAPALAVADVGIAMGSGTDAAQQTAALTLRNSSLAGVVNAMNLSRATFSNIRQNLFWAFGYNVLLIPMAMAGRLTPMLAAAAMAFSSVFVVLNALRLLRFDVQE